MWRTFILALACVAASGQDDPKESGPVSLIIQYRCLPGQRTALRQRVFGESQHNFERWHGAGMLSSYHLLFSRYVDTNSWDMLALMTFPTYNDVAHWHRIEAEMPAGLVPDTLSLTSIVETYPVDLVRQGASQETPAKPVYFVVPYTISVPVPVYLKYFDDYVRPQFDGWIHEGVLSSYQVFMQRYIAARPWDVMIFLVYKDDDSFGQREKIVAKVRAQLQSNPVWKAASDSKQNLRMEKQAIIADDLTIPR